MLGILLIAIITFYSRNKKLAEKLRQCELIGPVADQLKKVGKLESQREGVRGGSVTLPHFILSFVLRHRPIFDVSDFPMLLGFRFSTNRTIDSISVSFYHFLWDF
jgi:hypothetical protein